MGTPSVSACRSFEPMDIELFSHLVTYAVNTSAVAFSALVVFLLLKTN